MSNDTNAPLTEVTLSVPGMMCDGCAEKVRDALLAVPGVRQAKSSARRKRASVRFEPSRVGPAEIRSALADKGFESEEARA
ncbi:heavy-metal-associated domain-containing protein [Methylobacterium aquaticum]|nr:MULTISPECIES: heavy metal-associated domain-containing protein [Methylobacterium]MBK3399709.1 heavy-metal-associated domain-containing protein [Methylobacterium ajmalii]MBK3410823.1 heavy-metal-associated domain-containing protein [Methylobacterium ajmalii]MBK3422299.1 heavy-metal-associated domain-containing protein [Methylobacterium ajmalii]MBZ6415605.1 heavy-metal-associated domain-containing protein [Methylobacterium sp.]